MAPTSSEFAVAAAGGAPRGGIHVLCVGNELAHDDGVGILVGRILQELELGPQIQVRFLQHVGFDLVDVLRVAEQVIIVDAARTGRRPGTCFRLDPADLDPQLGHVVSCHGIGLPELLGVARRLDPQSANARVTIVCIEVEDVRPYGFGLSARVQQAMPEALTMVLDLVGVSEATAGRATTLARLARSWVGSVGDAHVG